MKFLTLESVGLTIDGPCKYTREEIESALNEVWPYLKDRPEPNVLDVCVRVALRRLKERGQ